MEDLTYKLIKKIDGLSEKFKEKEQMKSVSTSQIKKVSYWVYSNWLYHTIDFRFFNGKGNCDFYDKDGNEQNLNFKRKVFNKRTVIEVVNELKLHYTLHRHSDYFSGQSLYPVR